MKTKTTWVDNLVGFFSPKAKADRLKGRAVADILERKYEGAGRGRRTSGWSTSNASASSELARALPLLRDRSRDLVRNNPYAHRGVQAIENNVVGKGTKVQFKTKPNRRTDEINARWRAWANDPKVCDFDGRKDFSGLERLAMRGCVEGGESLVRVRKVSRQFAIDPVTGRSVEVPPIQLQMLESDFIASNRLSGLQPSSGNSILQGIEFDKNGKRVGYHLFKNHPGNFNLTPISSSQAVLIPAQEIAHIYRVDRAGQIRGCPWLSNIIIKLRDLDEFSDANLVRQKIAAMYTAFVHDIDGLDDNLTEVEKGELGEKMEPGVIEFLPPGKDIKLASPPMLDNYESYMSVELHAVAAGLGIPYEILTSNLREVNFSSARMGFLEFQRNVDAWRADIMKPQFLNTATDWFLESLQLIGVRTNDVQKVFTSPRREMIDPAKETNANKSAVRSGFKTLSEVVREIGRDPDEHFAELLRDKELIDKLGLTLDTDASKDLKL